MLMMSRSFTFFALCTMPIITMLLTRRRKCRNLEQAQAHGQGEEQGQTALENVFLISHYILPFFAGIRMQSIRRPGWHGAMCAL